MLRVDDGDGRSGLLRSYRAHSAVRMDDVEPVRAAPQLLADARADGEIADQVLEQPARETARQPEHETAQRCEPHRHHNQSWGNDHVLGVDIRDQRDCVPTLDERPRELEGDELGATGPSPDRDNAP